MEIEFRARVTDLRDAARELTVNRGEYKEVDFADVLVSSCVATFRSVGTSKDIPVDAIRVGCARIPFRTLERIVRTVRTFKKSEVTIWVGTGILKIGSWSHRDAAITTGVPPDRSIDIPIDACIADTLAVSKLLTSQRISEQGLNGRVESARNKAEEAISQAASALGVLGISCDEIQQLVDNHLTEVSTRLARALTQK